MNSYRNILFDIPVILSIEIICGSIWLYVFFYNIDITKISFNYKRIIENYEWWRILSGSLTHKQLLHLAFNLLGLWNGLILEKHFLGSFIYLQLTFLLLIFSNLAMIACYFILHRMGRDYTDIHCIGYSGVLFGLMSYECWRYGGQMSIFGFDIHLASYLYPFLSLIIIQVLVPNASFVGHLSGILCGFMFAMPLFYKQSYIVLSILSSVFGVLSVIALCFSIFKSNVFGIQTKLQLPWNSNSTKRRVRISNGVIIRDPL